MNNIAWVLIAGIATVVSLRIFKVEISVGTGFACGLAFLAGMASQHIHLF